MLQLVQTQHIAMTGLSLPDEAFVAVLVYHCQGVHLSERAIHIPFYVLDVGPGGKESLCNKLLCMKDFVYVLSISNCFQLHKFIDSAYNYKGLICSVRTHEECWRVYRRGNP